MFSYSVVASVARFEEYAQGEGVECYCSLARSISDENELEKSDSHFGERGGSGIGGLGIFAAAAIHITIRHAERRRAPGFAMAALYHRKTAADAPVSD